MTGMVEHLIFIPPIWRRRVFSKSMFELGHNWSPRYWVDHWVNPPRFAASALINGKTIEVSWTKRAQRELNKRPNALIVEMQLYFSCVVKKRVLFHEVNPKSTIKLNDDIELVFRAIQPTSCDPIEFAQHYPVKHELAGPAVGKMSPKILKIDFKDNVWVGEYRF
jgi:hypothetical protein